MNKSTRTLVLSALMVSIMLILGFIESRLPSGPVPGIKIGLSNSVLLIALYSMGIPATFALMVVKVVLSGFMFAGVSAMMYGLAGGLLSVVVMSVLSRFKGISCVGAGIAGGVSHNIGQVGLAMIILKTDSLVYYLAILMLVGGFMGGLTGMVCKLMMKRLPKDFVHEERRMKMEYNRPQTSPEDMKKNVKNNIPKIKLAVIAAAIIIFAVCVLFVYPPYTTVPTGHTGVVVTFGRVEDYTLSEGFHLKNPFQQIVMMDNRTQKKTIESQAFSSDIQQVNLICSVNYSVDRETAQTLYKSVGVNYYSTVMEPRILENVKAVFTRYSAEKLMQVRDTLSSQVVELLEPEMKKYGIQIVAVAIENVDFTDAFTNAVEDKQVAEQTKLRVETEQAQQVSVEKSTAERQIISANADAEKRTIIANADASVKKIEADAAAYARKIEAETEAAANKLIAASITSELVDYLKINQWNGQLPQITAGDGVMPIIDLTEKKAD